MRVKQQEAEAEKAFEDTHTFRPGFGVGEGSAKKKKVIRKRDGTPVQSRFRQVAASPCQRPTDQKDKRCSFTPTVTGVRGNMSSAKVRGCEEHSDGLENSSLDILYVNSSLRSSVRFARRSCT